jgi:hypothetical protein
MRTCLVLWSAVFTVVFGASATAQPASIGGLTASGQAPLPGPTNPEGQCCTIPAGTVVQLQTAELISSNSVKTGNSFSLQLAEAITISGRVIVPALTVGNGEIIDAARGGYGGKPGKLVLAARAIEYHGIRIPIHGFHLTGSGPGANISDAIDALNGMGGIGYHDIELPRGTRGTAKVSADVFIPLRVAEPTIPQSSTSQPTGSTSVRP